MFIVEMRISPQPFQESFLKYEDCVTWSWMLSLWEMCDLFDVEIELDENFIKPPRERDEWLMQLFMKAGFYKDSLRRLNRV